MDTKIRSKAPVVRVFVLGMLLLALAFSGSLSTIGHVPTAEAVDSTAQTVSASDLPKNIPDAGQVSSTLTFPNSGAIVDLTLVFIFTHECENDLVIDLVAPDGHVVGVMNHGLMRCSGVPETFISNNTAVGSPEFFGGREAGGAWTLVVSDTSAGFTGTLDEFSLTISVPQNPIPIPSAGPWALVLIAGLAAAILIRQSVSGAGNPR